MNTDPLRCAEHIIFGKGKIDQTDKWNQGQHSKSKYPGRYIEIALILLSKHFFLHSYLRSIIQCFLWNHSRRLPLSVISCKGGGFFYSAPALCRSLQLILSWQLLLLRRMPPPELHLYTSFFLRIPESVSGFHCCPPWTAHHWQNCNPLPDP